MTDIFPLFSDVLMRRSPVKNVKKKSLVPQFFCLVSDQFPAHTAFTKSTTSFLHFKVRNKTLVFEL